MPGWNGLNIMCALEIRATVRLTQQVGQNLNGTIPTRMDLRCYGHRMHDIPLSGQYGLGFVTNVRDCEGSQAKPPRTVKPPFHDANYTLCLSRWGEQLAFLGSVSRCSEGQSFEGMNNHSALAVAWEDIWCCEGPLLETPPANWSGTCAPVQLAVIFTLAFRHSDPSPKQTNHRARRSSCPRWVI